MYPDELAALNAMLVDGAERFTRRGALEDLEQTLTRSGRPWRTPALCRAPAGPTVGFGRRPAARAS